MRKTEKVSVTKEVEKIVERCCDLCGTKAKKDSGEWKECSYNYGTETEIRVAIRSYEHDTNYHNGSWKEYNVDLCPSCFKEKLLPWLVGQGAKIAENSYEW